MFVPETGEHAVLPLSREERVWVRAWVAGIVLTLHMYRGVKMHTCVVCIVHMIIPAAVDRA